jgi:hypothetical protein
MVLLMTEMSQPKRGGKAFHSILEPHFDFIREQRLRRKTWQEIADLLASDKGVRVTLYAPYHFYRRQLKRRARGHWEDGQPPLVVPPARANETASRPESGKPVLAAVPIERSFRKPNPDSINLNDPTKV